MSHGAYTVPEIWESAAYSEQRTGIGGSPRYVKANSDCHRVDLCDVDDAEVGRVAHLV